MRARCLYLWSKLHMLTASLSADKLRSGGKKAQREAVLKVVGAQLGTNVDLLREDVNLEVPCYEK